MRRAFRALILTTAAVTAAVGLWVGFTVPARRLDLQAVLPPTVAYGAYHVHTSVSDGRSTPDEVAAAAKQAGLRFLIFTDHGDGTRTPDPPTYRHGVLCIDAVEISTDAGHVVAIGLTAPAPYRLGGTGESVIEDIRRLGGWAVVAHPDSPKPELAWRGPRSLGVDGIEWINADSEWRDEPAGRLLAVAARSLFRGPESIASIFNRPARSLQRWDSASRRGRVVGLAATDAHARLQVTDSEVPGGGRGVLPWPRYVDMFRALAQAVVLDAPLSGNARADSGAVTEALRRGRTFSIVRGLADPATLEFTATFDETSVGPGERLFAGGEVTLSARVDPAPGVEVTILHDNRPIATGRGAVTRRTPAVPGAYRVEAAFPGVAVPWLMSNAIAIGAPDVEPRVEVPAPDTFVPIGAGGRWSIERDPASHGTVTPEHGGVRLEFTLGDGPRAGQYAAAAAVVDERIAVERVRFIGSASRPMRVSLQARLPGSLAQDLRWRRSVYLDQTPRPIDVRLEDLEPVGVQATQRPVAARVSSLLFVVDLVNAKPGDQGSVWLHDVSLGVGSAAGGVGR